jgi:hypothetical protein
MPKPGEHKTVQPRIFVYAEVMVLSLLARVKAKQPKYDLNLPNGTKGERIALRTRGKPGAALTAQSKGRLLRCV